MFEKVDRIARLIQWLTEGLIPSTLKKFLLVDWSGDQQLRGRLRLLVVWSPYQQGIWVNNGFGDCVYLLMGQATNNGVEFNFRFQILDFSPASLIVSPDQQGLPANNSIALQPLWRKNRT